MIRKNYLVFLVLITIATVITIIATFILCEKC